MTKLDEFIKGLNLSFTDTLEDGEYRQTGDRIYDLKVDTSRAFTISRYVEIFNRLYVEFRKDLEKLEPLKVGDNIEVMSYLEQEEDKDKNREERKKVCFSIENSRITKKRNINLYFEECDGKLFAYTKTVKCNQSFEFMRSDREEIDFPEDLIKSYIDFVRKHKFFIQLFYHLKKKRIHTTELGDIWCNIDLGKATLFDEFNHFNVCMITNDIARSFAQVSYNLGENLHIDYKMSELRVTNADQNEENINRVSNELYINASYVRNRNRTN